MTSLSTGCRSTVAGAFLLASSLAVLVTGADADVRRGSVKSAAPGGVHGSFSVSQATIAEVLQCLLGQGVLVSNVVTQGPPAAFGRFAGGGTIIGFNTGVVISTGDVVSIPGPNELDDTSTDHSLPGDTDLDALIPGFATFDAAVLEFDFECTQSDVFSMDFVFASEEYNEYVDSDYNDVFAFFLDGNAVGNNVARVPGFCQTPGLPVAINNVNCGNPLAGPYPGPGQNCGCYRNNDIDEGGTIDTEMDGLTAPFGFSANVGPGTHHMKIAIADAGDGILDSAVFLRCESLACSESSPSRKSTWGETKVRYR